MRAKPKHSRRDRRGPWPLAGAVTVIARDGTFERLPSLDRGELAAVVYAGNRRGRGAAA